MILPTWAALIGLCFTIILILRKVHPVYALFSGAIFSGICGGLGFTEILPILIDGAKSMMPAILRILAAGVLAGVLIESGAANRLAIGIMKTFGKRYSLLALTLSTLLLTAIGVFVDVAVITVAPIALETGRKTNLSKFSILLAMIGGGKCGNIMSPNPNAIAITENLHIDLYALMGAGVLPSVLGCVFTVWLAGRLKNWGKRIELLNDIEKKESLLPSFWSAISGPLVAIGLLAARPLVDIKIDPIYALPCGGIFGCLMMGKAKELNSYTLSGLQKMGNVALLLVGTGVLAGVIGASEIKTDLIYLLEQSGLPAYSLAPLSGILLSGATASTTSGAAVASSVFGTKLVSIGISSLAAGAMIHSGATVLDHLPHGSFFHATGGIVGMDVKERLKLLPFESTIGLVLVFFSVLFLGWQ